MKKIILLSDGTGNGAAKRHKTNVWRLHDALDLHRADQIAMYDDGVGSQQFLLFKLLGGAFGWGLKRNVIELYKFLCRNYEACDAGGKPDRIYLFGFSRGAFTVRVLAGLIDRCGLCTEFESERDLHALARANYAIYRTKYKRWRLSRLFACLMDCIRTRKSTVERTVVWPGIGFIGVWDTVDAYGLPVDELAVLWDRFIFPMRFEERTLSKRVEKACHALSIDDERHTFHPVLWDESEEGAAGRIEQVWFPGVHSDVGGGYPRHNLALVSLDWMISKVETNVEDQAGLVFVNELREDYRRRCDWSGIQHDSRAGLRAFYRYKPRDIEVLCGAAGATRPETGAPRIHRSAFERIRAGVVPYAPTGIPAQYNIATTRGAAPEYESEEEREGRSAAMIRARHVIRWRRWLYRAFVATTMVLATSPAWVAGEKGAPCGGFACFLEPACALVGTVLPEFARVWVGALCQNPGLLAALAGMYGILCLCKRSAAVLTYERAAKAWSAVKESRMGRRAPEC